MYDFMFLIEILYGVGKYVVIEIFGVYVLKGNVDWYIFFFKKFKVFVFQVYERVLELKVVIYYWFDFEWVKLYVKFVYFDCFLYIQFEWLKQEWLLLEIIVFVKEYFEWCLFL